MRRTKIIATVGPSSDKKEMLMGMIKRGADSLRINFAHGDHKIFRRYVEWIREIEKKLGKYIPIMGDIQTKVVRIKLDRDIEIKRNKVYKISTKEGIIVNEKSFYENIEEGNHILLDDGLIEMRVDSVDKNNYELRVTSLVNGVLRPNKKIIVKGKSSKGELLTDKDLMDIKFSVENNLELIAISMVRNGEDVERVREIVNELGGEPWIISKIEHPEALDKLDEITEESDGLLVARGDLGQHINLEEIPVIQRRIIDIGSKYGKITILATQILESMMRSETPTRAEVTDIFNAVEEGVDAIMLTGETAVGKYPVETIHWAAKILEYVDEYLMKRRSLHYKSDFIESLYDKFARGVIYISNLLNGRIVGYTKQGNTARRLSRYKPNIPIWINASSVDIARKINILYGITPVYEEGGKDIMETLQRVKERLRKSGELSKGDIVIYVVGMRREATDVMRFEII